MRADGMECGPFHGWTDAFMKETDTDVQHHSQLVKSSCRVEQKAQEDGCPHLGGSCCLVTSSPLPLKSLRLFLGG